MSNSDKKINRKKYWKNLKDYYDNPEVLKSKVDEFQDGVTEEFDPSNLTAFSRRKFLALVAASAAFGTAACSDVRKRGEIIPYTNRPTEVLPGKANYYASTCTGCSQGCGILVKTREGRPIKIDGNPDHPVNKGKICNIGQASILNLYDPERINEPMKNKNEISWEDADREIKLILDSAAKSGKEIALITDSINSPTEKKLLNEFIQSYPNVKIYSYNLISDKNRINAWKRSSGTADLPSVKWEEADLIVSLESDFLGREGNWIENARRFSERRDIMKNDNFNRLYVVEGGLSLTGMNADYRLKLRPDFQLEFVKFLNGAISGNGSASTENFAQEYSLDKNKLDHLVKDLRAKNGKTIVYAGNTLPEEVHSAVNELNKTLGAEKFYDFENKISGSQLSSFDEFKGLLSSMKNKKVGVVIHYDSNPVFQLPVDFAYADALKNVENVISITELENESSALSSYVLPLNNYLESWGDHQVRNNFISYQQPVISPLYNTRQREEIILNWMNGKQSDDAYHKYLLKNYEDEIISGQSNSTDSKRLWMTALHDGIVKLQNPKNYLSSNSGGSIDGAFGGSAKSSKKINADAYILHLQQSYFIGDGRFANNGWLQELPHPVSKITWDNYAALSPATAKELKVNNYDLIEVTVNETKMELPVFIQAGMADKLIVTELGYGREVCGDVGLGVGFNVNKFISSKNEISPWIYEAAVKKAGGSYELAATQEHHSLDDTFVKDFHKKREIIRDVTLDEYRKDHHAIHEKEHEIFSITDNYEYTGNKWAMAIDLNKCISCGVCVSSCNVENNIPVVGKEQVINGREMQWMRIDTYYSGTPDDPQVANQPMLCQHCDNAPCENVCPVNATNHSPDGLNQMVYNRCVGTRYCSNNCPYKVRRFNFFNFRDHFEDGYYDKEVTKLMRNPEVTVRARGVMEKCTFCVQRIMEARTDAIKEGRDLVGSDIKTACQEACPAEAIVFGDANDPKSEVSKYREHDLGYHVLETLNVKPNVTYLARLRNIAPEEE